VSFPPKRKNAALVHDLHVCTSEQKNIAQQPEWYWKNILRTGQNARTCSWSPRMHFRIKHVHLRIKTIAKWIETIATQPELYRKGYCLCHFPQVVMSAFAKGTLACINPRVGLGIFFKFQVQETDVPEGFPCLEGFLFQYLWFRGFIRIKDLIVLKIKHECRKWAPLQIYHYHHSWDAIGLINILRRFDTIPFLPSSWLMCCKDSLRLFVLQGGWALLDLICSRRTSR